MEKNKIVQESLNLSRNTIIHYYHKNQRLYEFINNYIIDDIYYSKNWKSEYRKQQICLIFPNLLSNNEGIINPIINKKHNLGKEITISNSIERQKILECDLYISISIIGEIRILKNRFG